MVDDTSIGLLMIVRDEAKILAECLESTRNLFDQTVIVDTGSIDNTPEIARRYTPDVLSFDWQDDFSAARNFAKSKMRTSWIFHMDADDRVEYFDKSEFCNLVSSHHAAAFLVKRSDDLGAGQFFMDNELRIFKNHPDIFWKYPVHEQITESLLRFCQKTKYQVANSPFRVIHKGYRPYFIKQKDKYTRNLRILQKAVTGKDADLYLRLKLISALRMVDTLKFRSEIEVAVQEFLQAFKKTPREQLSVQKATLAFPFEAACLIELLEEAVLHDIIQTYRSRKIEPVELGYLEYTAAVKLNQKTKAQNLKEKLLNILQTSPEQLSPDLHRRLAAWVPPP